jgi:Zn-dependent M28 family amino/carboxypeptidase
LAENIAIILNKEVKANPALKDEIIIVGGHLDSWDVGRGAHDDGAGSCR